MKLDLNWDLSSVEERRSFAAAYVLEHQESLTNDNLNTIAEYVLWADLANNPDLPFEITTERSPWKSRKSDVSIEGLFKEAEETGRPVELLLQRERTLPKVQGRLERVEVAKRLGTLDLPSLYERVHADELADLHGTTPQWIDLWTAIDLTEYRVQMWELTRGRRKNDKPIRDELKVERLGYVAYLRGTSLEDLTLSLNEEVEGIAPYAYLRLKRLLVSLRQQQYPLLDALPSRGGAFGNVALDFEGITSIPGFYPIEDATLRIDSIEEEHFEPTFQGRVIQALRRMDAKGAGSLYPDLREEETIRALLERREELASSLPTLPIEERQVVQSLLDYLHYYQMRAGLSEELNVVLEMKASRKTNREVKARLEEKYGLSYMENYISTIYTRRIVQAITKQAEEHVRMLEYLLMGRNVFKRCVDCKKLLPRNSEFFNKRGSTSDGFLSYCKECKGMRKEEKEKGKEKRETK